MSRKKRKIPYTWLGKDKIQRPHQNQKCKRVLAAISWQSSHKALRLPESGFCGICKKKLNHLNLSKWVEPISFLWFDEIQIYTEFISIEMLYNEPLYSDPLFLLRDDISILKNLKWCSYG